MISLGALKAITAVLGLGLLVLWLVPRLLTHPQLFRAVVLVGLPPVPFIGFTVLEIVGAPLFLLWHKRLLNQRDATWAS